MRISGGSSDGCSSDLTLQPRGIEVEQHVPRRVGEQVGGEILLAHPPLAQHPPHPLGAQAIGGAILRFKAARADPVVEHRRAHLSGMITLAFAPPAMIGRRSGQAALSGQLAEQPLAPPTLHLPPVHTVPPLPPRDPPPHPAHRPHYPPTP